LHFAVAEIGASLILPKNDLSLRLKTLQPRPSDLTRFGLKAGIVEIARGVN
jgi:hypothetical protein